MRTRISLTAITVLAFAVAFFAMPAGASALTVVEPDAYAVGTDISSAFPGVTLTAIGGGWTTPAPAGPNVYAVDPMASGIPTFTASTGSLVFGTDHQTWPHQFREMDYIHLQVGFASATSYARIDFIGNNSHDVGILRAYDSSWTLIDQAITSVLIQDQVGTISVSSPLSNISYLIASGDSAISALGIDNLQYGAAPVPEPSTLCLVILGTIGVAIKRFKS